MAASAPRERAEPARVRNLVASLQPGDTIDIATPLKARKARTCLRPLIKDEYGGLMLHAFETITGGVRIKCRSMGWRMPSMGTPDALYHVTTREVATIILREGFKDRMTTVSHPPFGGTRTFTPGVWFADAPPISVVGDDGGYFGNVGRDEAWVRIKITPQDFDCYFLGNEILDDNSWATRQWLIKASKANLLPRDEISLRDVLAYRMRTEFEGIGDRLRVNFLRKMILTEMTDAIVKTRWLDALDAAVAMEEAA
jgi:hypothetical protein